MLRNLRELYQYRALLWALTSRELKARYRASALGFLWTFLNPTLLMLVYYLVFSVYARQNIPFYTFYLFIGLLPWLWFSSSLSAGASAISDRRDLLTKVRFPAQILPASVLLTNLCNFLLAVPLMILLGLFLGVVPTWHVILFPVIIAVQAVFSLALVYFISALNVSFRDLQHIVGNVLTLWFFVTPVLYSTSSIPEKYRYWLMFANPMAVLMEGYRSIFYHHQIPAFSHILVVFVGSVVLLGWASATFEKRREEFAELI